LHLASASPRRAEILDALGVSYTMAGMDIDEQQFAGESAATMVTRLAVAKALAAGRQHSGTILAADTAVVVGDDILGKPIDEEDALAMLAQLSGRSHQVLTGVALLHDGRERNALSSTEVRFREISPDEALAYWQSGEPRGKAGAYAIQGLAGAFVEHIVGSYTGVVGLPVFETVALLAGAGIDPLKRTATQ
jgi:septum formation protein